MKKIALLLALALLVGPLIRVTIKSLFDGLGNDASIAATVVVVALLLVVGALALLRLEAQPQKPQKSGPPEASPEDGLTWPVLPQPTARDDSPSLPRASAPHDTSATVLHSSSMPSQEVGAKRWRWPWWTVLVALLLCLALVRVVDGPATKVPRTSPSWRPDKRVSDDVEQKVAQAGLTVSDIKLGDWRPCVDFAQVTDVSCLSRPVYWQGEEVGILIDSPSAEKPEARQHFIWLGRPNSPWPKLPWKPRSAAPR